MAQITREFLKGFDKEVLIELFISYVAFQVTQKDIMRVALMYRYKKCQAEITKLIDKSIELAGDISKYEEWMEIQNKISDLFEEENKISKMLFSQ
jgi:hypothetical protein